MKRKLSWIITLGLTALVVGMGSTASVQAQGRYDGDHDRYYRHYHDGDRDRYDRRNHDSDRQEWNRERRDLRRDARRLEWLEDRRDALRRCHDWAGVRAVSREILRLRRDMARDRHDLYRD